MFAVGHLSLGYISGFAASKAFRTNINMPLILLLSIMPDIDIVIQQFQHRGPTHSIITSVIFFIPFLIVYKKRAAPYAAAMIQHFLIGDFIAGGNIQLFWPISREYYGLELGITNPINITAEWILFIIAVSIMFKTNQITTFFQPHHSNLLLSISLPTVLLPTFLSFPLGVTIWLLPLHLAYLFMFSTSVIIDLIKILRDI